MAVKSYALTTRQRLIDFLGLGTVSDTTKQNVLDRIIDAVTEFIENYIGYRIKLTTYTNEEYDTEEGNKLILDKFPVVTFTQLQRRNSSLNEDNWETIDSQYYHVDLNAGIIYGAGVGKYGAGWEFAKTRRGYRVTYSAGYDFDNAVTFLSDTQAGDLEFAMWTLCGIAWNQRKQGGGVQSERVGDYSVTFRKAIYENEDLKAILDKYARSEAGSYQGPALY